MKASSGFLLFALVICDNRNMMTFNKTPQVKSQQMDSFYLRQLFIVILIHEDKQKYIKIIEELIDRLNIIEK